MNAKLLIELLETFADKQAAFKAAHAADYQSAICKKTYEEMEVAYEEIEEELMDVVREEPQLLAAALQSILDVRTG